jgi:glycosyltransferase involved in cell wall biosynthesis
MEKFNFQLADTLAQIVPTVLIARARNKTWQIVPFMAGAFVRGLYEIWIKGATHIHIGDGVLSPLGVALSKCTKKPVTVTLYGLDVTYNSHGYQRLIMPFIKKIGTYITISSATTDECVRKGIPKSSIHQIGIGIDPDEFKNADVTNLPEEIVQFLHQKTVLFTAGRLVRRKGVGWFVEHVLPLLPEQYVYVVSGTGQDEDRVRGIIRRNNLQKRVLMAGSTSRPVLEALFVSADVFVMPNIPVENDVEGFGIVALEAAAAGLPIVASRLGGIVDAVDPEAGILFAAGDIQAAVEAVITAQKISRTKVVNSVKRRSWKKIAEEYVAVFESMRRA